MFLYIKKVFIYQQTEKIWDRLRENSYNQCKNQRTDIKDL